MSLVSKRQGRILAMKRTVGMASVETRNYFITGEEEFESGVCEMRAKETGAKGSKRGRATRLGGEDVAVGVDDLLLVKGSGCTVLYIAYWSD